MQGWREAGHALPTSCPASLQVGRAGRTLEGVRQDMREARYQVGTAGGRQGRMEAGPGAGGAGQDRREAGQD